MKQVIDISGQNTYGQKQFKEELTGLFRSVLRLVRNSDDSIENDEAIKRLDIIEWLIYDCDIVHSTLKD